MLIGTSHVLCHSADSIVAAYCSMQLTICIVNYFSLIFSCTISGCAAQKILFLKLSVSSSKFSDRSMVLIDEPDHLYMEL